MNVLGSLHLILLLLAVAVTAAMCGFIASFVALRNKRRGRKFFVLGVLTGFAAALITRGSYRRRSAFGTVARGFVRPRRAHLASDRLVVAASRLRRVRIGATR